MVEEERSVELSPSGRSSETTGADLQQDTSAHGDASLDQQAVREAQLEAEDQLVVRLRMQRFKGEEYDRFEARLVRYALRVLDGWLRHGRIFHSCAAIGRGLSPTDRERDRLHDSPEDREDLATLVVGCAILRFRQDALIEGGWKRSKGASIATYFMNCVIREFPNHFRAWQREEQRWRPPPAAVPKEQWLSDPGELAAQRAAVIAALQTLPSSSQAIVALHFDGWSNAQIAEVEGKTTKAVERVLERWRKQQRQLRTKGA
ncbi:sigma factor-like helix-turn-helix DNA-binding protein [Kribbella sp. NPDC048928]|uniref:sigma factor-like helix-turn-helix DNA-binding protein n=1 Tax=Kribbella sp. NPDC048928 TaxID=3364111 RepID=UPI003714BDB2